jgi:hypothetical protein
MQQKVILDAFDMVADLYGRLKSEFDTFEGPKRERYKRARELDRVLKTYVALRDERTRYLKALSQPKKERAEIEVGNCPCGLPIKIGSRYAVNIEGPTTIARKCPGTPYAPCGRSNVVILEARRKLIRATYKIIDCTCGMAIHIRSDYAGGPGFPGYDREGKSQYDIRTDAQEKPKNRTVKTDCPECGCKSKLEIRFIERDDGRYRTLGDGSRVEKCRSCEAKQGRDE